MVVESIYATQQFNGKLLPVYHYQLVTTTESEQTAGDLAAAIIEARLGACVHVMPITSVYRWNGEVTRDAEWRLVVKTAGDRLAQLIAFVRERHSYDVPQLAATRITGSDDYLAWVTTETRPRRGTSR